MADKKISQLTNLTGASLAEDDEFVLVDTSADETKAITWSELKEGLDTGTGFVRITGDTMTGDLTVPNVVVSGNVGIGTSNPVQLLHLSKSGIAGVRIEDTDAAGGYVDLEVNGSAFFIDSHDEDGTEGLVVFRTAGTETMRINSSGNVGIGTSNPSQALEVNGSIRASGTGAAAIYIEDGASSSTDNRLIALFNDNGLRMQTRNSAGGFVSNDFMVETNASGAETFRFNVANSEVMRINSSGNVGIGTTSPEAILHVADGGSSNNNFTAMISAFRPNLTFQDRSAGTTNDWEIFVDSDDMAFLYGDATTGTKLANEAMRIKDSGNVGIGTASPQEKLHVIGSAKLDFGSAVGNPRLYFDHDTVTDDANYIQLNRGDAGLEIISEDNLKFDTNGLERMRIDSSGDVKISGNNATTDTRKLTVESEGYAVIMLNGDVSNTSGEPGGAALQLNVDGTGVNGIVSYIQQADDSGYGTTYTGTVGNSMLVGTTANAALIFGINSVAKLRLGNNQFFPITDNAFDLGSSSNRYDDIYATNGTIQTSDRNEKQDIEALSDAEQRVAVACKGLLRKFRWQDAVAEKGDDARIHFGIIAQDLQDAFAAEGLDAGDYAMFISSTWWETQTDVPAVEAVSEVLDEDGNVVTEAVEAKEAYTRTDTYETQEEVPEGATERTRLGVRYPELLAFIIAAI
ncbi:tail fiber domain-containing protein [bacterium]|nr:tail fiber domain-containing protein [bacterium]